MDRSIERRAFRRGFVAGFLALALASAGQVALSRSSGAAGACPASAGPGIAERLIEHLRPTVREHGGVAQRVALAVLEAMLHKTCS